MARIELLALVASLLIVCAFSRMDTRIWRDEESREEMQQKRQNSNAMWFTQPLDHLQKSGSPTWQQKYQVNSTFYKPGGPIFMFLGGEGPLRSDCTSGHYVLNYYAPQFNALIVCAEHRFYGDSIPTTNYSTGSLQFLTSEQALADFADLTTALLQQYNATQVISIGGSYSGMLSAWFRLRYSKLVTAALASSAPVNVQVDFPDYLNKVGFVLFHDDHRGRCFTAVANATATYSALLKTAAGQAQVAKLFNTCSDLSLPQDQVTWFEGFADAISGFVQYNKDNNGLYPFGVDVLCKKLEAGPINTAFPAFFQWYTANYTNETCMDSSYAKDIQELQDVDPKAKTASSRAWWFQTCNEFGFYQTAAGRQQPFSKNITLQYFTDICQTLFGINATQVAQNVKNTVAKYGNGDHLKTSNIVFVRGLVDPWSSLCNSNSNLTASLPSYHLNSGAHCSDLYPPRANDPGELTQVRLFIVQNLKKWLVKRPGAGHEDV